MLYGILMQFIINIPYYLPPPDAKFPSPIIVQSPFIGYSNARPTTFTYRAPYGVVLEYPFITSSFDYSGNGENSYRNHDN